MERTSAGQRRPLLDRYFYYMETRKPSDRFLLLVVIALLLGSIAYTLILFNNDQKTTIASRGGAFTEGIIGTPRFANPVLAITRTDQDIVSLVYSGLMQITPNGELIPDLASSITISDDGLVYNIIIRDDTYFHDGRPVRAHDVAFTISLVQDPMLKSPLRGNWSDVTVEVLSEKELNIVLKEAYAPFTENLTLGILPKHVWEDLSTEQLPFSQHNTDPIGSGPYQLDKTAHNNSGLIESYTLVAADQGERTAKISKIVLRFYQNEDALMTAFDAGEITSTAALSYDALSHINTDLYNTTTQPLPRTFAVFFNQNRSAALRDPAVRAALNTAVNRTELVETALHGYGFPIDSPIPPGFLTVEFPNASSTSETDTASSGIRHAEQLLIDAGWEQQEDRTWQKEIDDAPTTLSLTLTTANSEVFEETAAYLKSVWESLGVEVDVALYEQSDLVQTSIRPRDYQALLFGTELGRPLDFYPFWHSSQKDDPGLNVALYTNITTDELLTTARTAQDATERTDAIRAFESEIVTEHPALFLFSPSFAYVTRNDISITPMERIVRPSERFSNVRQWHMNESDIWSIFANN